MAYWTGEPLPKPKRPAHSLRSEELVAVVKYGRNLLEWEVRCTCRTKHTFTARLLSDAHAAWAAHAGVDNITSDDVRIGAEAMSA